VNSPAVTAAILANGNVLDPTVSETGINIFSNAVNTRSAAAGIGGHAEQQLRRHGPVDWSRRRQLQQGASVTRSTRRRPSCCRKRCWTDRDLGPGNRVAAKVRVNLGALWKMGNWTLNLREALYGKSYNWESPDGGSYYTKRDRQYRDHRSEVAYRYNGNWTISVGANNLFNKYPDGVNPQLLSVYRANLDNSAVTVLPTFSPFGINGGYYYARASFKF
jgi:iron complex outermembrane receptor protein